MSFATNKTKIVCTIGPSTDSAEMMLRMITAGMDIARLNYSHGNFAHHTAVIRRLRRAAKKAGKQIVIMADLPGPKIRIGTLKREPCILHPGDQIILSTEQFTGDWARVSVTLPELPSAVHPGAIIFLNDGLIQLQVTEVQGPDIVCKIIVGGDLRSHKGINVPGIDLGICAFTEHDAKCLRSALEGGVDAISQSFVNGPDDILAVRKAARELGYDPFIIAKMECSAALGRITEILQETDGMMIARGDLGVEIPIEQLAVVQKQLIAKANELGKPVITATQMLESMLRNPRPTRAEATDVANAILDGTDCIMLSEESAIGQYPIDAVQTLVRIASFTEAHRNEVSPNKSRADAYQPMDGNITDMVAHDVYHTVENLHPELLIAHTVSGYTARMISRFKLPVWILAACTDARVCQNLQFSYGVRALWIPRLPKEWKTLLKKQMQVHEIKQGLAVVVEVPCADNPAANHRLEIFPELSRL